MNSWTPTARRTLQQYLNRSRTSVATTGADPDEVAADLQRHVEEEVNAMRLSVVTENDVKQIVRRIGPWPLDEREADTPHSPPPPPSEPRSTLKGFSAWVLLFCGVVLPIITLAIELITHICAAVLFDPLPTWAHVILSCLVPVVNGLTWAALRQGISPIPKWLWYGNGAVLGVTLFYTLAFLPVTPFALLGVVFGLGLLALSPIIALASTFRFRRLLRNSLPESSPASRGWLAAFAATAVFLVALLLPEPITNHWINQAASETPGISASAVRKLRHWGNRDTLLKVAYGKRNAPFLFFLGQASVSTETAQQIFYRVTGEPYNAFPPPVSKFQESGRGLFNEFDWDRGLGGEQVAGRLRKLSITQSRVDGLCRLGLSRMDHGVQE